MTLFGWKGDPSLVGRVTATEATAYMRVLSAR